MKLYVGNISFNLNSQDIHSIFSAFGRIDSADVIYDRATGRSRGFAFVRMADDEGGNAIESLHGSLVDGRALVVSESKPSTTNRAAARSFAEQNHSSSPTSTYYGGRSW